MKFVMLHNFGVLGTIQLQDCCVISGFGRRDTGVADYHPICLKFKVILMVSSGFEVQF